MGTTEQYLYGNPDDLEGEFSEKLPVPLRPLNPTDADWRFAIIEEPVPLSVLDDLAVGYAAHTKGPALGAYVEDSDYAYVVVATGKGEPASLVLNADIAEDYADGDWGLKKSIERAGSEQWESDAAEKIAEWSRSSPRTIEANSVLATIEDDWENADDGLEQLLSGLGLATSQWPMLAKFQDAHLVDSSGKTGAGGHTFDNSKVRYVKGEGQDFLGIWDRTKAGPPIRRFPRTRDGRQDWYREFVSLNTKDQPRN